MKTNKIDFNLVFKNWRFPAFTIVELMIVIVIIAIVGGVAISAFFMTYRSYRQSDDHITAAEEVEFAMAALRPQFSNIGLGMPNNLEGQGSFNISFTGPDADSQPIMAYMGDIKRVNTAWGGPITLGNGNARNDLTSFVTERNDEGVFAGRELFYVWAVPTGVRLQRGSEWSKERTLFRSDIKDDVIEFKMLDRGDVRKLRDFTYDFDRQIGISNVNRGANTRSWFLFPSFRIPLLVEGSSTQNAIDEASDTIQARVSPYSFYDHNTGHDAIFEGSIFGFEEVHLLQAACIFSNGDKLIQRTYGESIRDYTDRELASNVLGVYFVFNDVRRMLTMYTIARGNFKEEVPKAHNRFYLKSKLPEFAPAPEDLVSDADMGYRILVESMTWRIRN